MIKRLIIHIPDKFTNTIRYYGFYCRPIRQYTKLRKLYNKIYFIARECLKSWRNKLKYYFNNDPLICKNCGKEMILDSVTLKSGKTISLNTS